VMQAVLQGEVSPALHRRLSAHLLHIRSRLCELIARAQAEGDVRGLGRLITTRKGKILGVSLVGRHAGDHIHVWALALSAKLKLSALTGMIAPYPTRGEIGKRLAGMWFTPALFSDRTRRLVSILKHFA